MSEADRKDVCSRRPLGAFGERVSEGELRDLATYVFEVTR